MTDRHNNHTSETHIMTKAKGEATLIPNHNPNLYLACRTSINGEMVGVALYPVVAWAAVTTCDRDQYVTETWPISVGTTWSDDDWCVIDIASGQWSSSECTQGSDGMEGVRLHLCDQPGAGGAA